MSAYFHSAIEFLFHSVSLPHRTKFAVFLGTSLFALTGCSMPLFGTAEGPQLQGNPTLEIDLFAARGFLGGTDYEQYKLSSGVMWRECGAILGKGQSTSQSDQSPTGTTRADSSLRPQELRIEELQRDELQKLTNLVHAALKTRAETTQPLPAPGSLFSLVEPGLIEIAVSLDGKRQRFITSVDAVSEPNLPLLQRLNQLHRAVRSIGRPICNGDSFYGISREH